MESIPVIDLGKRFGIDEIRINCQLGMYKNIKEFRDDLLRIVRFVTDDVDVFVIKLKDPETGEYYLSRESKRAAKVLKSLTIRIRNHEINALKVIFGPESADFSVSGVEFKSDMPGILSIFHGWRIQPRNYPHVLDRFFCFVRDVIANKDRSTFERILDWLAVLVQNPGLATGLTLVLIGQMGAGKSFFLHILSELFRGYSIVLPAAQSVTGRFNSVMEFKTLIGFDDQNQKMNATESNKLLSLITCETVASEKKFGDLHLDKNIHNFVICTNFEGPYVGRRFFVLRVSSAHINDEKYFDELKKDTDVKSPFYYALMDFLQNRNVKYFSRIASSSELKIAIERVAADDIDLLVADNLQLLAGGMLSSYLWDDYLERIGKPGMSQNAKMREEFGLGVSRWTRKVIRKHEGKKATYYVLLPEATGALQKLILHEDIEEEAVVDDPAVVEPADEDPNVDDPGENEDPDADDPTNVEPEVFTAIAADLAAATDYEKSGGGWRSKNSRYSSTTDDNTLSQTK